MLSTKGNTGKVRSKRQLNRILTVVAICISILVLYEMSGLGDKSRSHKDKIQRMRKPHIIQQQQQQHEKIRFGNLTDEEKLDLVIAGKVHLINLHVSDHHNLSHNSSYEGAITASFCQLDWSLHKNDPSSYAMFRALVEESRCDRTIDLDLQSTIAAVREFDAENSQIDKQATSNADGKRRYRVDLHNGGYVHTMEPKGFVFHESRCGSTLAANSLAAFEPSMNRVYSESPPPVTAAKVCSSSSNARNRKRGGRERGNGNDKNNLCPKGRAAEIIRDTMYLMGRTDDEEEQNLFFKIQSVGSKSIHLFTEAYPETPWIYVYREPVQVMMSHLKQGGNRANCVRQLDKSDVSEELMRRLRQDKGSSDPLDELSTEEECALHLSMLCNSAVENLLSEESLGRPVNYENLATKMIEHIIPEHFKVVMTDERRENILQVSSQYSKGMGKRKGDWKDDTQKKENLATPEVRNAASYFLKDSYEWMEEESSSQAQYYNAQDDFAGGIGQ